MVYERRSFSVKVINEAALSPVTLAQARKNSRIDHEDDDQHIQDCIDAATGYVQRMTDTALITTLFEWKMDRFPLGSTPLYLPRWPVQSIASISYTDTNGTTQTIASNSYSLRADNSGRGRISLVSWNPWPSTLNSPDSVSIRFHAGFGDSPTDVPREWQKPILLLASHWIENREATVGSMSKQIEFSVSALLDALRDPDDGQDFDLGSFNDSYWRWASQ